VKRRIALLAALTCALGAAAPATALGRARFDTRVLALIPRPGFPALSLVVPDGTIYVGTYENPSGDSYPSRVLEYSSEGTLERSWTIQGQDLSQAHGVQVAARDAHGRLILLDHNPPRALTLDPRTGEQKLYATFYDVPPCATASAGAVCSQTVTDNTSQPDYAAWAPDGALYVTDYVQGLIWRVPPGGGRAQVWLTDARLDGGMFGTSGIVLEPNLRSLLVTQASSQGPGTGNPTTGRLYRLPILPNGAPGALEQLWESGPAEAPDGFAVARSGNIYIALVGPGANQIVEVSSQGAELTRFPTSHNGADGSPVPFDEPSSVQFDGTRLIVTNLSYIAGDATHQALLDVESGELGQPIFVPAPTGGAAPAAVSKARLTGLILSPAAFAAESGGASARGATARGATVSFTLDRAATAVFTVKRRIAGRQARHGNRITCDRATRGNRKHRACTRLVTVAGSFTRSGAAGANRFHFTGRLAGKKLAPGSYRLAATPRNGAGGGVGATAVFKIVP
jgi:sugar lactone lactonase YvrE